MNEQDVTNHFVTPNLCGGRDPGLSTLRQGALPWVPQPALPKPTLQLKEQRGQRVQLQHHSHQYINCPLSLAWKFHFVSALCAPGPLGLGKVFPHLHSLCWTHILSSLQGLAGFCCLLKGHVHSSHQTSVGHLPPLWRMKQEAQSPGVCMLWLLKPALLPAGAASAHTAELGDCTSVLTASPTDSSPGDEKPLKNKPKPNKNQLQFCGCTSATSADWS